MCACSFVKGMRFTILVGAGEDYLQHLDVNEAEENGGDLLDGTMAQRSGHLGALDPV